MIRPRNFNDLIFLSSLLSSGFLLRQTLHTDLPLEAPGLALQWEELHYLKKSSKVPKLSLIGVDCCLRCPVLDLSPRPDT